MQFFKEPNLHFIITHIENYNLEDDEYDSEDCENESQDSEEVFDEDETEGDLKHSTNDNDEVTLTHLANLVGHISTHVKHTNVLD